MAAAVAYAVHSLYDWDWEIPGVTLPALLFLGVLGGSLRRAVRRRGRGWGPLPAAAPTTPRPLACALGVGAIAACLAAFTASVIVPRLAAAKASQALVAASRASSADLRPALATALESSRLDPLSDAGLKAASTIAVHLGRVSQARRLTLEAVSRQPTDAQAWQQLAFQDFALGADREALAAAQRARALDPEDAATTALASGAMLALSPPAGSATAVPTPASARRGAAP